MVIKNNNLKIATQRIFILVFVLFWGARSIAQATAALPKYQEATINRAVIALKHNYEFIYFHSGNCQHCLDFTPILKLYSARSGIAVQAFVVGTGSLASFPKSSLVQQQVIEQYFGRGAKISVPTLFILNKDNYHAYPVSCGALSYLELSARMNTLASKIWQHEKASRKSISTQPRGNNA